MDTNCVRENGGAVWKTIALMTGMQKPFIQKYVHVYSQEYIHIGKYPQMTACVDRITCQSRYS